jgi:hypothetical protein
VGTTKDRENDLNAAAETLLPEKSSAVTRLLGCGRSLKTTENAENAEKKERNKWR